MAGLTLCSEVKVHRYLVLIDFPGIKHFVFGTDVASEIRGASAFLERWGKEQIVKELTGMAPDHTTWKTIYVGGGSGMFLVEATDAQPLDRSLRLFAARTAMETEGALSFAWAIVPYEDDDSFGLKLAHAHTILSSRRTILDGPRLNTVSLPLLQECSSCSRPGVTSQHKRSSEDDWEWLCPACALKRQEGESLRMSRRVHRDRQESDTWQLLTKAMQEKQPNLESVVPPRDLQAMAQKSGRSGYLGLVYMDGDSMGRALKSLKSPEEYAVFSRGVDSSMRQAFSDAVVRLATKGYFGAQHEDDAHTELPLDIFLLGGDDLVVVTTANAAVPLAIEVARGFKKRTKQFFEDHGILRAQGSGADDPIPLALTASAGVALFKHNIPFHMVIYQAEQLLRSAKRTRSQRTDGQPEAFIDVANVSQTEFVDIASIREELTTVVTDGGKHTRKFRKTIWPLPATLAGRFWAILEDLSDQVSKSKIQQLAASLESPLRADKELMRILPRLKSRTSSLRHGAWDSVVGLFDLFDMWRDNRPRAWKVVAGDEPDVELHISHLLDVATLGRFAETPHRGAQTGTGEEA